MEFAVELEIHQLKPEEVRRGWVRIEESTRRRIKSGSLILLKCGKKKSRRIVIGVPPSYMGLDELNDKIFMDEVTREELGFFEDSYRGRNYMLTIIEPCWPSRWFLHTPLYYWRHPDFPVNFASKIASISFIVGWAALILTVVFRIWPKR